MDFYFYIIHIVRIHIGKFEYQHILYKTMDFAICISYSCIAVYDHLFQQRSVFIVCLSYEAYR